MMEPESSSEFDRVRDALAHFIGRTLVEITEEPNRHGADVFLHFDHGETLVFHVRDDEGFEIIE